VSIYDSNSLEITVNVREPQGLDSTYRIDSVM